MAHVNILATLCLGILLKSAKGSGDLQLSESVSWTSLWKLRNNWTHCDEEFTLFHLNVKWDFCSEVPPDQFGGDYRKVNIPTPNMIKRSNSNSFANRNCFCDKDCGKFGDCCLDSAEKASYDGLDEDQDRWVCSKLPGAIPVFVNAIYVIGKCSKEWIDRNGFYDNAKETKSKCHMNSESKAHYTQYIPVLSTKTNVTYRNVYCAICNDDFSVKTWNVTIKCNDSISEKEIADGQYLHEDTFYPFFRHWQFEHKGKIIHCRVQVEEFVKGFEYAQTYNARACKAVVDTCHPNWPDSKDRERCRKYASYIYKEWDGTGENVTVYKNYHCVRCNYVDMDRLVCVATDVIGYPINYIGTLSILFDFNIQSGIVVGRSAAGCFPGEFYDPLRKRCVALHCARLYKFVDGNCVPDKDSQFLNTSLQSDCKTVHLLPEDYTILSNQTVWVNATGRLYGLGEYELLEADNFSTSGLAICKEDHYETFFRFSSAQAILSDVCLYISITCLTLQIISYTLVPKLRNLPGKNLLSLSSSLLVAQLLFLFGLGANEVQLLCSAMAVAMHFFFMAYFFWMNVMAMDVCRTFSSNTYRRGSGRKTFLRYSCYAWWTPTVIVTSAIAIDNIEQLDVSFRPGYGKEICWITQKKALILFFAVPVAVIILINIVMFSLTVWHIRRSDAMAQRATKKSDKIRVFLYIKLSIIMGLTWILGFIAAFIDSEVLWYPFVVFNGLQGAFIFIAFSCKRKVLVLAMESVKSLSTSTSKTTSSATKKDSRTTTASTNITTNSFVSSSDSAKRNRISNLEVSVVQNNSKKPGSTETRVKKRSVNNLKVPNFNESDV